MVTKMRLIAKRILPLIPVMFMIFATGAAAEEEEVRVNAPEFVSGTFDVTIDIYDVTDLYGGQFDLSFDPDVVNVNDIYEGVIDGATVLIDTWDLTEEDRACVLFNIDDSENPEGVSGSGYLASIRFEVVGDDGDVSDIEISEGLLSCYGSDYHPCLAGNALMKETNADWSGDVVTVGTAPSIPVKTPTPTQVPTIAVTSTLTATSRQTSAPNPELSALTVKAQDGPTVAVPDTSSEKDKLQDIITPHNFIAIYSFVGLLAFVYTLTLLR